MKSKIEFAVDEGGIPETGCHVGRVPAPLLVKTCPVVPKPETFWRAPVEVVPPVTTANAVNEVSPVPPPATTAVPNIGSAEDPCEIKGIPLVADGAASPNALEDPSARSTLCAVCVPSLAARAADVTEACASDPAIACAFVASVLTPF